MAKSSSHLLDSFDNTPQLPLGNAEELISQLAGDEIDRLIGPGEQWQPHTAPRAASPAKPDDAESVEQLTAQLDEVFEQIRRQELTPPPPVLDMTEPEPITLPEPVLAMRRMDEAEAKEIESRRSLLESRSKRPPLPRILRPIAWLNGPVAQLSGRTKLAVSFVSLISLIGSVAALVYVLVIRQGI